MKAAAKKEAKLQLKGTDNEGAKASKKAEADMAKMHPLLSRLQVIGQGLSVVGYASVRDTAAVNKIIYSAVAKQILPANLRLLWSAKPADGIQAKNFYELHAIKVTTTNGRAPLEGDVVTDAKDQFNNISNQPEVSMSMNTDGARRWAALTKANTGRAIAIVLDGSDYSAPRVNGETDSIGQVGYLLYTIASDVDGNLYGIARDMNVESTDDNNSFLVKIPADTIAAGRTTATPVAANTKLGVNVYYQQSMEFDRTNHRLWWLSQSSSGNPYLALEPLEVFQ